MRLKLIGLAGAAALLVPAVAQAQEVVEPGTAAFVGIGETMTVEEGHQYFAGKFNGAFVATGEPGLFQHAAIMCAGYNDIGRTAGGYCVYTIGTGESATAEWSCVDAAPPPGAILSGDCQVSWVSGTGQLAGISGGATYTALLLPPNPDGTISGVAVFDGGLTYTLPN